MKGVRGRRVVCAGRLLGPGPALRLWLLAAAMVVAGQTMAAAEVTVYVGPGGDDGNNGRSAEQALRTPTAAQERLRAARDDGAEGPFAIVLADGRYPLEQTLTFAAADGGTAEEPVVWRAADGARPVVSGGRKLEGWQPPEEGDVWTLKVDAVVEGDWYFHQLWVDGERATRARHPNEGYLYTAGPLPEFSNPHEHRGNPEAGLGFRYRDGDLERWDNFDDVNVYVYHAWTASLHWLDGLDTDAQEVHFENPSAWPIGWWDRTDQRYHVENFRAALDEPGEWYLDRDSGVLHYWPREGEDLREAEVIAPRVRQLVRVEGDGEAGEIVEGLRFEGLAFEHAKWEVPGRGRADGQSVSFAEAAVHVEAARAVSFEEGCTIAHVGEHGLWLARGAQDCVVRQTRIHDVGAGAVRIGEPSSPQADWQAVERNVVDNCFLHDGGNVFPAGCGVLLQRASHNEITHNEISDFYYTGVSLGWSWGYDESSAHHNLVRYNHVHHLGQGVLSDMGGIYTLGVSPGTEVTHNVFHDIRSYAYGGWGLYTDEGSSDILMAHNLVYRTKTGGFHQHYGRDNTVRNNILAFSATHQVQRTRNEDHNSFDFERNIVVFDNGELLDGNWSNDHFVMRDNVYWDVSGEPLDFAGHSFEQWQERGHDEGSVVADPRLAGGDFGGGVFGEEAAELTWDDFRVEDDSPALERGFERLDLERVGLYGDEAWVRLPETVENPEVIFETEPRTQGVAEDFEAYAAGTQPAEAQIVGVNEAGEVAVSEQTASQGSRSLRFKDAPGLAAVWHPHAYWTLDLRHGEVVARFELRLEPGADFFVEWRDGASPYRTGPRVAFGPDGAVTGPGGRALGQVPHGEWFEVEMTTQLGPDADGTYAVTIRVEGEADQQFGDLPLPSEDFRLFQWFGIASTANADAVFYLDNLVIEPAENGD